MRHNATPETVRLFFRSNIDYAKYYLLLFAAFNSWYRDITGESNDAAALKVLQNHVTVWHRLLSDESQQGILTIMRKLYVLTQHRYVHGGVAMRWDGRLSDPFDWQGLQWFWYEIRCRLVHGNVRNDSVLDDLYVRYAYESLSIFMSEAVREVDYEFKT